MQFVRTAARLAQLLRLRPPRPTVLDIDLSTLAPGDTHAPVLDTASLTVAQLVEPAAAEAQDWRTTSPWRTQPGVRYHL
jgi:hypothetical protein